MKDLPLKNIRIADFGAVITAPWATGLLAFMGAEVIKIESLKKPDLARTIHTVVADGIPGLNRSLVNSFNCNKRACTIDLSLSTGQELARSIIKISDVVAECFTFGVMDRLGLGYRTLQQIKPDIIMLSISGPGRTGPDKDYLCFGHTIHAYAGLTAQVGYPGGPPRGLGTTYTDPLTGLTGSYALLAAIHHAANTGRGQYIDLAMSEATMVQFPETVMDYLMNQRVSPCTGNRDEIMAPHNCYPCRGEDKWIAVTVSGDGEWQSLCKVMKSPSWCKDIKFSDGYSRWQNQDELDKLLSTWIINHHSYELTRLLQKSGVPAGPSLNAEELVNDPHLKERGFFIETDHPEIGRRVVAGRPWKLSAMPQVEYKYAPLIGEDNEYVFGDLLGMPKTEIKQLIEEKIIY